MLMNQRKQQTHMRRQLGRTVGKQVFANVRESNLLINSNFTLQFVKNVQLRLLFGNNAKTCVNTPNRTHVHNLISHNNVNL